jgi:hypothetical protein
MASWWDRFPGRLEFELADYDARGLDFKVDEGLFRDADRVLLRGHLEHDGLVVTLEVLYPDLFPYLRPEVYAPELTLDRHQNPDLRNLCLLDRPTRAWQPQDTGAWLVAERVPMLLSLFKAGPEVMAAAEAAQGEPYSVYFPSIAGTVVFVPAAALELDPDLRVGSGRLAFAPELPPAWAIRGLLCELVVRPRANKAKLVAQADEALLRRFGGPQIQMRWVRLDAMPASFDAEALFAAAEGVQPGFGRPPWQRVSDGEVAITGCVVPEEVRQGEVEDAWVFAVRWRRRSGAEQHEGSYVIRGDRLTSEDLGARIPKLAPLRAAKIAQIGLGALGAPLALELARNQAGELRLLEHDLVEAAQIVRWPLGLEATGHRKLDVVAQFVERNYPYTNVERFQHQLGQTGLERHARSENEMEKLERFLDRASLVLDASAEIGIGQLVSEFAHERSLRQLFVSATEGARGGQIALMVPGAGGCWYCWRQHALERTIALPPHDGDAMVQPRGCASPTFTGASFDLLPIIAQSARLAAFAVSDSEIESWVWVCEVPSDGMSAPVWRDQPIPVHPACPICAEG